ncbi:hypothetical protein YPPY66_3738, partial [Yersinia pestis PY-66]
MSVYNMAGG